MKTITELNNNWWYRLLKVGFIGFVLFCVFLSVTLVIDFYRPEQVKDYKISCVADYTNKKTFFAEKDLDIFIFQVGGESLYEYLSDNDKVKIKEICDISDEEAQNATKKILDYITKETSLGKSELEIDWYIDDNLRPYIISETTVIKGNYFSTVLYSVASVIFILLIAEIMRRIFYYVVLGSVKPKKI